MPHNTTIKKVRRLLLQYADAVNKLRELGIIRSGRVVSDYGEHVVCKKFGLTQLKNPVSGGYDALDKKGTKYEIKSRKATAYNKPTLFRISARQLASADFVIYIEFDNAWNITKLLKFPINAVKPNGRVFLSKTFVERFNVLN